MSITLENVSKRYAGQSVLDRVSLEVQTGELFVLLGASGSGKSTVLRLISGLMPPDEGTIRLHGRDVTALPPQRRDVGFVFQNYSIFRHMTVAENIEFGLRIRGVPSAERASRRDELLDLVGLGGLGGRYESELSGGQLQRVALARALAYRPAVLLLDEPFGALDVKIRAQLRQNLKQIQKTLGVTTILVTHDQEEAFELGQRIGVIERGRLLEVGGPEDLYSHPKSLYAAIFLGAGTILVGRCSSDRAELGPMTLPIPPEVPHGEGDRVRVLFRPEQVTLHQEKPPPNAKVLGQGDLIEENFVGATRRARVRLPPLPRTRQLSPALPFGEDSLLIDAAVPADGRPIPKQPWVVLEHWHFLRQPTPRLLVFDAGEGPNPALQIARPLLDALDGAATVLGVAGRADDQELLREAIGRRASEAGLESAALRTRFGDPDEQIVLEQADASYDFVLLGEVEPPSRTVWRRTAGLAESLIEQVTTPVLLARGEPGRPRRILICTAVGEPGKADVRAGGWLARRLAATATLLHVSRGEKIVPSHVQAHLERGVATLRELGVAGQISIRDAESAIDGILAELAAAPHDLVVVGGPARGSRPGLLRGDSITRQVLRQCRCSVLVVPEGTW
ncbi:MAG TPA: ATP-binding cassette domain-containing protein [Thermoanaerobaculia bacterium]|nr:ATP-binding cassette domain-containing protein [Thermoanaerobaculia bacterium]